MKSKKLLAMTLAATMALGSSMTVLAVDETGAQGAEGTGKTFEHLDKDIIAVTLPTTSDVADVFDYYVDPEGLIKDAGTLDDGTEVEGNTDGVYFKKSSAATNTPAVDASVTAYSIGGVTTGLKVEVPSTTAANLTYKAQLVDSVPSDGWYEGTDETTVVTVNITDDGNGSVPTPNTGDTITVSPYQAAQTGSATTTYGSSSDEVSFEGKNSVAVDVTVTATVAASEGGKDIALVADEAALAASKTPALLMKLKVGDDVKTVTDSGAKASATIAGVPDNFAVTAEGNKFVYKIRTNTDPDDGGTALDEWKSTTVQLIGKTNGVDVTEGMTAPKINLTWSPSKHVEAAETTSYTSATSVSAANKSMTLTMPENVTVSKVDLVLNETTTTLARGNHYTVSGNTLNIAKYAAGWAGGKIKITYSDEHVDELTCE